MSTHRTSSCIFTTKPLIGHMHVCDYRVMPRIYCSEPIVKTFAKKVSQTEFYLRKCFFGFCKITIQKHLGLFAKNTLEIWIDSIPSSTIVVDKRPILQRERRHGVKLRSWQSRVLTTTSWHGRRSSRHRWSSLVSNPWRQSPRD